MLRHEVIRSFSTSAKSFDAIQWAKRIHKQNFLAFLLKENCIYFYFHNHFVQSFCTHLDFFTDSDSNEWSIPKRFDCFGENVSCINADVLISRGRAKWRCANYMGLKSLVSDALRKWNEEKCFRHWNDFVKHSVMSELWRPYIGSCMWVHNNIITTQIHTWDCFQQGFIVNARQLIWTTIVLVEFMCSNERKRQREGVSSEHRRRLQSPLLNTMMCTS